MSDAAAIQQAMLAEAQKKFGEFVHGAPDHEKTHFGVPLRHLSLQYLLTSTVFLLSRSYEIFGIAGLGKSTLLYEFLEMVMEEGGLGAYVENEGKASCALMKKVMRKHYANLQYHYAPSLEDTQRRVTFLMDWVKKNSKMALPFLIGWDSLAGVKTEKTQQAVGADGAASVNYSSEANILSTYFGTMSNMLYKWPLALMVINHEKPKTGETKGGISIPEEYNFKTMGGTAPTFQFTYRIQMKKADMAGKNSKALEPYRTVKLHTFKNSVGPQGRTITVRITEKFDESAEPDAYGVKPTYMEFDWNRSTCDMLANNPDVITALNNIDIKVMEGSEKGTYKCEELGIEHYLSADDFCDQLYTMDEAMHRIRSALKIEPYQLFSPQLMREYVPPKEKKEGKKSKATEKQSEAKPAAEKPKPVKARPAPKVIKPAEGEAIDVEAKEVKTEAGDAQS